MRVVAARRVDGHCLGCGAPIAYEIFGDRPRPELEPVNELCAIYCSGHLCPPCTKAVMKFLDGRRERRAKAST